jgi:hypothetical protein
LLCSAAGFKFVSCRGLISCCWESLGVLHGAEV